MFDELSKGLRGLRDIKNDAAASRDARLRAKEQQQQGGSLFVPAELMGKEVTARCTKCPRTVKNKVEVLAGRMATKKTRCETCGGALEFPPEVHAVIERSSQEHSREAEARLAVQGLFCPVCNRGVKAERPGVLIKCGFCSLAFQVTSDGRAAAPPSEIPPAEPRDLDPHLRRLARHEPLAENVVSARAKRREVSIAEAVTLAARFDALATWMRAPTAERLPLPPEEVPPVLTNLIFPGQVFFTEPQDLSDGGTLSVSLEQQGKKVSGAKVLTNVLSLATAAAGAGGLFFLDLDGGPGKRRDLLIELTPGNDGTILTVHLATDGKRSACPPKVLHAWTERVKALGSAMRSTLLRRALFGPYALGAPLFMLTAEAATARLRELKTETPGALVALGLG